MILPPPIPAWQLPLGTRLNAEYGFSEVIADFDFETYSPAGFVWSYAANKWLGVKGTSSKGKGLPTVGAAVYTEHPSAEVLSLAYNLKDSRGIRTWIPTRHTELPLDLFYYLQSGGLIEAWNVSFETWVWENICVPKYGFPHLPFDQLRCAAAKARAFCLPGGLENAGEVLNSTIKKDKEGKRLLNLFSIPQDPTVKRPSTRIQLIDELIDAEKLYEYNRRDIMAEAEIASFIPDLSVDELKFWQVDQKINRRGVQIDIELVNKLIPIVEKAYMKYEKELFEISEGQIESSAEISKIIKWAKTQEVDLDNLTDEYIQSTLELRWDLPQNVRRVLEIRNLLGWASIKKLYAMRNRCTDAGRIHDLFIYHGARTGRASGTGLQPQNMPNSGVPVAKCICGKWSVSMSVCYFCGNDKIKNFEEWNIEATEQVLELAEYESLELIEYHYENALSVISTSLRSLIIAAPGKQLICSDYSAIEAVVLACLAGEQWRLDIFKTHGKIYEATAAKISGIPLDEILAYGKLNKGQPHPQRKIGKVAELASGYQGGLGAWKKFKAHHYLTDSQINDAVKAWRAASPNIVKMWHGLEDAAKNAICNPGITFTYRNIQYLKLNKNLYCILPSGRYLTYHNASISRNTGKFGNDQIVFDTWVSTRNAWLKQDTYGGKLTENVVQAVSRDVFSYAIINLEEKGYPVVLHVYDEIVSEIDRGFGSIEEFEIIMSTLPNWCKEWPIKASGGWIGVRYKK